MENTPRSGAILASIDRDLLASLLCLPEGQFVASAEWSFLKDCLEVRIVGAGLPVVPEMCPPMHVKPQVRSWTVTDLKWGS